MAVVIYYGRSDLLCVVFLVWQGPLGSSTEGSFGKGWAFAHLTYLGEKIGCTPKGAYGNTAF